MSSSSTGYGNTSNVGSRLDPRVDDPSYGRSTATSAGQGTSTLEHGLSNTHLSNPPVNSSSTLASSQAGTGGNTYLSNQEAGTSNSVVHPHAGAQGPHYSVLANKLDPNVDERTGAVRDESLVSPHTHQTITGGSGIAGAGTTAPSALGLGTDATTGSTTGHHYGRDAAIGGAAVGAGYEAGNLGHQGHLGHGHHAAAGTAGNTGMIGSNDTTGYGSGISGTPAVTTADKPLPGAPDGTAGMLHARTGDNLGVAAVPGQHTGHHHHSAEEAAVAGAGAGALGVHEHHQHHGHDTVGPHSSDMANRADPRVDSDNSQGYGGQQTLAAGSASNTGGHHHLGRDAGIVGGTGVAGYEAEKHHHGHHHNDPTSTSSGPHSSDMANRADPRVDSDQSKHHFGRDAVVAGTGVGVAEHEHKKHGLFGGHHKEPASTTTGPHMSGTANQVDPVVYSDGSKHHHDGRDAAVVGGVGAAGYEAEKHHGHHHNPTTATDGVTSGPRTTDIANRADPRVDSDNSRHHHGRDAAVLGAVGAAGYEAEKHHGRHHEPTNISGPHSSDMANRADPRVDSDNSGHHLGRDTVVAGAGVGVAEHEHKKHGLFGGHHDKTAADTTSTDTHHHVDRDTAAVGGTVGVAEHEHKKHGLFGGHHDNPTTDTTTDEHHHVGRDTAVVGATAGVAEHEHRKHEHEEGKPGLVDRLLHRNRDQDGHNKLHKEPHGKYADTVTGGTGTTAYESQGITGASTGFHPGVAVGSGTAGGYERRADGSMVDPVTGLPVNTAKYGAPGVHGTGKSISFPSATL